MGGRFVDNGDGTVTDNCTGLMWQQETAPIGRVTWQAGLQYCARLDLAKYTDWRLPNVRELQGIIDYGRFNPAIDPVLRGYDPGYPWYWSSTTMVHQRDGAWGVSFSIGAVDGAPANKQRYPGYVRAVRTIRGDE